ncbi:hypothetical protein EKE94_05165 [Mesobaculum littorinae]|uniref:Uncharacterized protein n=1 Tax=Mesobaculum littorinae TaxID=2486419 RepID=A0A438AHX0_9RHOB|nr:hypothetical protein [Mesobaculum littorinae]RVV98321.1 hypothetical protein EKE94_05165 [Mesobaculum littorinae]
MTGLLEGYRAASLWTVIGTLDSFGAMPTHEPVVNDRNQATDGGVAAGVDFGPPLAATIVGVEYARVLELAVDPNPQPPFSTRYPPIADADTPARARPVIEESVSPARIRAPDRQRLSRDKGAL